MLATVLILAIMNTTHCFSLHFVSRSGRRLLQTLVIAAFCLLSVAIAMAQADRVQPIDPAKPPLTIPMMWDQAFEQAVARHKPALIFDLDYIDSSSIVVRDRILADPSVQKYLTENFVLGLDDFSVDPPPSVGFDSLRHLGLRLSGLEEKYHIVLRPCVIILLPDSSELDRIPYPHELDAAGFVTRVQEIMMGKHTIAAYREEFYKDPTSIKNREALIEQYQFRSNYDSVLFHLAALGANKESPLVALDARTRYAYMRLKIEGNTDAMYELMGSLGRSGDDSIRYLNALHDMLDHFLGAKKPDSTSVYYETIMNFTHDRSPDLLNDWAWDLVNHTHQTEKALALVKEAIAKRPDSPDYYDTKALIDYSLNRPESALKDAEQAAKLASTEDTGYFNGQVEIYREQLQEKMHPKPKTDPEGVTPGAEEKHTKKPTH